MGVTILLLNFAAMIQFDRFILENGLTVIVHEDKTTPMAVVDVLYDVGARDEDPEHTGFAHLFEHLMFGGSINIPSYDEPLQRAGGENNAYTSNDLTNYYCQLPAENIETALWLESDRMLSLAFDSNSLEVQRKVVSEEFKEHYINKPYGDVWEHLRKLSYKVHPYRWLTIGKELSHIEKATLKEVKQFFQQHYNPSNAILILAGNITLDKAKSLTEKWFGDIPAGKKYVRNLPQEPLQTEKRFEEIKAKIPLDALYKSWHISPRMDPRYYATDLITEIMGSGASSRLYERLVKGKQYFSSISCSHTGSIDAGLLVIEGKLSKGISIEAGDREIEIELDSLKREAIKDIELQKVKNKVESMIAFEDISIISRADSLANYELLGDADLINRELAGYQAVTPKELITIANDIFSEQNSNTLYYRSAT